MPPPTHAMTSNDFAVNQRSLQALWPDFDRGAGPMMRGSKVTAGHLRRDAYVYVRQATVMQVREHTESLQRQYELAERAVELGWPTARVVVIDEDLGRSGADASARAGFQRLVADVGLGQSA